MIQTLKLGARIMRYELTDREWAGIKPMLPNKPRGVPRVNDRRVLNGIFWILRSGAPWRDLPGAFGTYTTGYNRFVRWRRAGVWATISKQSGKNVPDATTAFKTVACLNAILAHAKFGGTVLVVGSCTVVVV